MEAKIFNYTKEDGWSVKTFPALDSPNTLILVFAAPEYFDNPKPIKQLSNFYQKSKMIGCSTAGEIFESSIKDKSISVAVIRFDATKIKIIKTKIKDVDDSYAAGKKITTALERKDLSGIFVLSDGININGTALTCGLNSISKKTVVTGGLAGDGNRFKKTWGIYQGKIEKQIITAVGFYGDKIQVGHGSKGGWDTFGTERRITRSEGNVLYELDNKPALTLYKEYLGERASELPASGLLFPLAIRQDVHDTRHLVRTILGINEEDQSLIFAGDMPTGYFAQLMRANFDRLIFGAHQAGILATKELDQKKKIQGDILAVAVSCVGRRLLLGERTEEETESTLASFPEGTLQIGFYSYGELSPYTTGNCDLHNQTMTLTTFYEDINEAS